MPEKQSNLKFKPSVHTMMNTLKDMRLIKKNLYGEVFFTDAGFELAEKYAGYYRIVSTMLSAYLSSKTDIRSAACAVLAEVSEEGLAQLRDSILTKRKKDYYNGHCGVSECEQNLYQRRSRAKGA